MSSVYDAAITTECILKEAVFGREESNLPYLTAQENVSRRQGYVQYLPDSRSRLETYYVTSHGPLLQEHFLVSETERLRQEFLNVYRNRTGCTEDVLRTLKCTMFLVETPLGDRYVPFQAVVRYVVILYSIDTMMKYNSSNSNYIICIHLL